MPDTIVQRLFPWLLLAAVLISSLAFVAAYGANLPRADEWRDALVLLEGRPLTLEWLWAPHNVHRAPLSRLIRYGLYALTGDFRSALVFSVLIMGAAAAALLFAVRKIRGGSSWADLLIPLVVVGPGHYMNFLWGFQVAFTLSAALFIAAIALIAATEGPPPPRRLAWIGLLALLQVMTGANGLALALPLLAWIGWAALRGPGAGFAARGTALGLAGAAALITLAYPVGLEMHHSPAPFRNAIPTALQFVSTGLTPAAPWWKGRAALVLALAIGAVLVLAGARKSRSSDNWRVWGLGSCLAACLLLSLMVGVGRRDLGAHAGLFPRYITLAAPLICLIFVTFTLYGRSRWATAVPALLALLALPATAVNTAMAVGYGDLRHRQVRLLEEDARRGLPPGAIAARNGTAIYQYTQGVRGYLDRLMERRAWPFQEYEIDQEIRTEVVSRRDECCQVTLLNDLTSGDSPYYTITGPAPRLELDLTGLGPVAGVELSFVLEAPEDRMMRMEVHWDGAGAAGTSDYPWWTRRAAFPIRPGSEEQTLTVWIYDTIDRLRIDPDRAPARLRLTGLNVMDLAPDWLPPGEGGQR